MPVRASSPAPVAAAEFARLMASLEPPDSIAVAFSGGPDSLALLYLAAVWTRRKKSRKLLALTVDHGLRPESAAEAKEAASMAARLGVAHRILKWTGKKPRGDIQAAARQARYDLLIEACGKQGAEALLVAHHMEDQAETFLLRLARGSGVDGLAAMPPVRMMDGIRLLRPLLPLPKARLEATLKVRKLSAIADPSNENTRFDRVKARQMMAALEGLGLDAPRLARTATHMARARAALEDETRKLLSQARLRPEGYVDIDAGSVAAAPEEIALRALAEMFKWLSGAAYAPRFEALQSIYAALLDGSLARPRTLGGCRLHVDDRNKLLGLREPAAALKLPPVPVVKGRPVVWDGRFRLTLRRAPRAASRLEWRALGEEGLAILRKAGIPLPPEGPRAVLRSLPGLWTGRTLLAAPHAPLFAPACQTRMEVVITGLFPSICLPSDDG